MNIQHVHRMLNRPSGSSAQTGRLPRPFVVTHTQPARCRSQRLDVVEAQDVEARIVEPDAQPEYAVVDMPATDQDEAWEEWTAPTLPIGSFPTPVTPVPGSQRSFLPELNPQQLADMLGLGDTVVPAYLTGLQELSAAAGGPVMYQLPRNPNSPDPSTLPLMLYLPGIDGTGLAAYRQFPAVTEKFELRGLFIPPSDRSSFEEIVQAAQTQLEAELMGGDPLRPVYLIGESFGGLVALALAERCDAVDRVVLCNPATSFSDSVWPLAGPLLTALPPNIYNVLPIALSPILTNPINIAMHSLPARAFDFLPHSPFDVASSAAWGLVGLLPELGSLRAVLPPATLSHRLGLLRDGSRTVNGMLGKVQQRVLLLVGENDLVIPSATEGPRLKKALPRCNLRVLPGRSHAMLQEAGLDLTSIFEEEGFYVRRRVLSSAPHVHSKHNRRRPAKSGATFGRPLPVELPTSIEIQRALDEGGLSLLRTLVSPVFFSTDPETGLRQQGLTHVPAGRPGRPVLLVGNHQTFAPDLPIMIAEFLRERGVMVRGLAHPIALEGMTASGSDSKRSSSAGGNPFGSFLKTFGGVPVSGKNMHSLFAAGETALVFPGGVREAYKLRDEKYQLIWPNRPEFVRMAAKFGATIVPFGAIGAEDGINQVLDARELQNLPVVGDWLRSQQASAPQARRGVSAADTNIDNFTPPLVTFNPPARFYYSFGTPIETSPDLASDRATCDRLYREVRESCAGNISYLLDKRQDDPYGDLIKRLLYEATRSGKQQAPTFIP